jgi:NitT/TauT family transport system substrate-binding protein
MRDRRFSVMLALAIGGGVAAAGAAAAEEPACSGPPRKINVGVSVSPPNVVHTPPYVAKALGYFAKRCIDVTIIQFDSAASPANVAAVSQGTAMAALTENAIAQGVKGHQVWGMAPHIAQEYFVAESVKTLQDLKGKRLSAAGGIGSYNWQMGRNLLRLAGLRDDDAQFISQGTAGRLPGLLAGQIDGVVLHPEDSYIASREKPGAHSLMKLAEMLPNMMFNSYGAADIMVARDRDLVRDTIAGMIEANRTIYRDKATVVPIMMEATQKPREAVEYAVDQMTRNCVWSVNTGFDPARTEWTEQFAIGNGDLDAAKHAEFERIVDIKLAADAVAAVGGPMTINNCKD